MRPQQPETEQIGGRVRERGQDHREPQRLGSRKKTAQDFNKQPEGQGDQKNARQGRRTRFGDNRSAHCIEAHGIDGGIPEIVERGAQQGLPRYMDWYAAFGLLVTLVWLYLEMLRLLARLRQ